MQPLPAHVSTVHGAMKKKKLDSKSKYNNILQIAKNLASIASQEDQDTYNKLLAIMKWLTINFQNKSREELKITAADFLGIETGIALMELETTEDM